MANKILKQCPFLEKNRYTRVFRFTDYESAVRFEKFTMTGAGKIVKKLIRKGF